MTVQNKKYRSAPESFIALLVILLIFHAFHNALAANTGYISDENPAPESTRDIKSPIGNLLSKEKARQSFFPALKKKMEALEEPFWRDTSLILNIRTYYFYRDKIDTSKVQTSHLSKAYCLQNTLGPRILSIAHPL
jgi:hypothetical protein